MAITASASGGTRAWSDTASWVGGVVPGASDDVLLTVTSGAITIDGTTGSPSACRSMTCTGFTGTLTQGSTGVLNIGDASGGSLLLVAGMTYAPNVNSTINFISTTTGNTVTFAGKAAGNNLNFNGVGGGWTFQDNNTSEPIITFNNGSLNLNGKTLSIFNFISNFQTTRSLTLGAAAITLTGGTNAWNLDATNLTFSQSGSSFTLSGSAAQFLGGGLTYNTINCTGSGVHRIGGTNTFASLTRTGTAVKTDGLTLNDDQIITGTCTLTGNSAINRLIINSNNLGTPRSLSAATFTFQRVDLRDITKAGAGSGNISAITGLSGDCGGNTGWTFTTGINCYLKIAASANWSASNWFTTSGGAVAARVPLPQDTAVIDANSISGASRIIAQDMPRIPSVNFTGVTNTPAWSKSAATEFYGSLTLANGITQSGTGAYTYRGQSSNSLTGGSTTWTNPLVIDCAGGTLTIPSTLTCSNSITVTTGTLDASSQTITGATTITCAGGTLNAGTLSLSSTLTLTSGTMTIGSGGITAPLFSSSNTNTRTLNMGSGTWTMNSTTAVWSTSTITNFTFNPQTSTILVSNTSASTKTFSAGNLTYNNIRVNGAAGAGIVGFSGNPTISTWTFDPDANIQGVSGNTYTFTTLNATGTAGHTISIASNSAGNRTTFAQATGTVSCDYLVLTDNTASGSTPFYAGANSTNGGGNTNWNFTAPPVAGNGAVYLGSTKINQLYLGSIQIKRAYLGSILVYKDT